MNHYHDRYKGIHPGIVLQRELKKRGIRQRPFAISINEHPQTLNAITKGKRNLNTPLALKIEEKLGLEEGTLAVLQTYFDIQHEKRKQPSTTPNLTNLRRSLFWDTAMESIDWQKQYMAIIRRVFERGNDEEKKEIHRFYGGQKIKAVLNSEGKKADPTTIT